MISRTFLNPVQHMTSRHPLCVVSGALLVIILCCFSTSRAYVTRIEQCEPIEIPRCRAMPYNLTRMPNLVHHSNQVNARLVFEKYEVLIDRHCSDVLLFLLCSIYVPICALTSKSTAVPPCRGVCERARAGCEPLMNAYDVSWPEFLNCSNLPVYEQEMCVIPEAIVKSDGRKKACDCKRRRPSLKLLRKHNYDFAIRGSAVKRQRISSTRMNVTFAVVQVLFSGQVEVSAPSTVTLQVNSSCLCPKLRKSREYLVMGHEDKQTNTLMLTHQSIATKWKNPWSRTIKRWHRRLQSRAARKDQRKKRSRKGNKQGGATNGKRGRGRPNRGKKKGGRRLNHRRKTIGRLPFSSVRPLFPDDLLHGYTHGGRYYTKKMLKKYNLAAFREEE